ncbi:MAG: hypothetical protein P8I97_10710 [Verrucomicrobiales bacterium]|nr:hypothetical protein [Verrucomicrobiales bacterium]
MKNSENTQLKVFEWFLRSTCAIMFIGHSWVCFNGQMPLRALLWDENIMSDIITRLSGQDWNWWVTSFQIDEKISHCVIVQGFIFLFFAAASLIPIRKKSFRYIHLISCINLVFLAFLKYLDNRIGIGNLLEHATQFTCPLVLFLFTANNNLNRSTELLAKVSVALTFIFHGLFAINFRHDWIWLNHSRPGNFTEMVMICLGIHEEGSANLILFIAGILDFLAAILLFTKIKLMRLSLFYMILWGLLTSIARPWAYFNKSSIIESLNSWIPEMLYRTPHFAIPLCLLLALKIKCANDADLLHR